MLTLNDATDKMTDVEGVFSLYLIPLATLTYSLSPLQKCHFEIGSFIP